MLSVFCFVLLWFENVQVYIYKFGFDNLYLLFSFRSFRNNAKQHNRTTWNGKNVQKIFFFFV